MLATDNEVPRSIPGSLFFLFVYDEIPELRNLGTPEFMPRSFISSVCLPHFNRRIIYLGTNLQENNELLLFEISAIVSIWNS